MFIIGSVIASIIAVVAIVVFLKKKTAVNSDYDKNNLIEVTASNGDVFKLHAAHVTGGGKSSEDRTAADLLSDLNQLNLTLMKELKIKYVLNQDNEFSHRSVLTKRLLNNYNQDVIKEITPLNPAGDTSYTINKGEDLVFCLRMKEDGNNCDGGNNCVKSKQFDLHHLHVLFFVAIHEMAHLTTPSYDNHNEEFWTNFKWLLREAQSSGLYKPVNYRLHPVDYCGLHINYSPLYDDNLPEINI